MPLSKQQLGSLLWGIADTGLRGKVEDYKAYILSLLFFKRLSDNYEWETARRLEQFRDSYAKNPTLSNCSDLKKRAMPSSSHPCAFGKTFATPSWRTRIKSWVCSRICG